MNRRWIKIGLFSGAVIAVMCFLGNIFYATPDRQTFSCTGRQKIYLDAGESVDVSVKISVQKQRAGVTVKGIYQRGDGTWSKIYRQASYRYRHLNNELYEATLLSVQKIFNDESPDKLSNYLFGIRPDETRNFRVRTLRQNLMMFGSEYAWIYACRVND